MPLIAPPAKTRPVGDRIDLFLEAYTSILLIVRIHVMRRVACPVISSSASAMGRFQPCRG
jgi:hypothetical protein